MKLVELMLSIEVVSDAQAAAGKSAAWTLAPTRVSGMSPPHSA
ncbi:hypothetical protein [Sphaerisporangium siamense]|uniref:Uncharacterized protein n=1 Tax=Sphaerisporangium siamense TaxID=795645 RepID=A0A7W7D7G9_9ACTN|nr:hypothetical protein [Sphaerisporangium siamense]MBB4700278.1 hypothetical protein [Sphaerisporangium siamense]